MLKEAPHLVMEHCIETKTCKASEPPLPQRRELRCTGVFMRRFSLTVRGASDTVQRVSAAGKRLVTVAILLGWTAPSAAALGVGLHLAAGHHGDHGMQHEHELADLARAATHGHHHDLGSAPDHDHDATLEGQARAPVAGPSFAALLPTSPLPPATLAEGSRFDGSSRRGPPTPLFCAHCSLLL